MKKVAIGVNSNYKKGIMPSTHAEADALKKVSRKKNIPKMIDIVVIRCSKEGIIGESRPCYHCILTMSKSRLNIKNIYYTTRNGEMVKEELCEMIKHPDKSYISSGIKQKNKMLSVNKTN